MDGIGAAASIITLVDLAKEALELRRRFINAPDGLQRLLVRVDSLAFESRILLETRESFSDDDFDTREPYRLPKLRRKYADTACKDSKCR